MFMYYCNIYVVVLWFGCFVVLCGKRNDKYFVVVNGNFRYDRPPVFRIPGERREVLRHRAGHQCQKTEVYLYTPSVPIHINLFTGVVLLYAAFAPGSGFGDNVSRRLQVNSNTGRR